MPSRSVDIGKAFREGRNFRDGYEAIVRANTVSLQSILAQYGIRIDPFTLRCTCPFPSHQDHNPSFQFYPDTNSFHCWSCKSKGASPVDFVSLYEGISKEDAAGKIIAAYDLDEEEIEDKREERAEYNRIVLDFSSLVREFICAHVDDTGSLKYAEILTKAFDDTMAKHKNIDSNGLKKVVMQLKAKLEGYKS